MCGGCFLLVAVTEIDRLDFYSYQQTAKNLPNSSMTKRMPENFVF